MEYISKNISGNMTDETIFSFIIKSQIQSYRILRLRLSQWAMRRKAVVGRSFGSWWSLKRRFSINNLSQILSLSCSHSDCIHIAFIWLAVRHEAGGTQMMSSSKNRRRRAVQLWTQWRNKANSCVMRRMRPDQAEKCSLNARLV